MKIHAKNFRASGSRPTSEARRRLKTSRRFARLVVESLESRQLMTVGPVSSAAIPAPYWTPTDTNLYDAQNGPMANLGTELVSIFKAYETGLGQVSPTLTSPSPSGSPTTALGQTVAVGLASQFPRVEFNSGLVGIDVKSLGGDFGQFVSTLTGLGMQVSASSATYGIVEGWVPVAELPTIAKLPQTMEGSPIEKPILNSSIGFQGFQGSAYNESGTALSADAARSQFGLTGAGVTVGVLSDSVSQNGQGLLGSYNTGDLSASNPVTVIQDGPNGATDEGRAMLENIHDIAPGANLQFATGDTGELGFMQNIEALQAAGSKVIVDDIGYFDEPMFQDGLIAQGVNYVTSRGSEYFSAAGNDGPNSGYLSSFRSVNTTVYGISGNFQNFNPGSGAANPLLPVSIGSNNALITFQYDQPYGAQEPAGATAHVTSRVDFFVFDSSGNLVASGTNNNVANNSPVQEVTIPSAGNYTVAIDVISGTAPSHVEFEGKNDTNGAVSVSTQYGSAGGTYYPSTAGHEASASTIGVAAVPWWAPAPFVSQSPLSTEPYSSSGPQLVDLSPKGTPLPAQIIQNPAISATDGGTTSFFGFQYSTSPAPFGGNPSSSFNLVPTSQQSLNGFFGTSSASPNAAAVTALMLQEVPTLNRVQILQALEKSATPMNGTSAGTWNSQSGYGLINAVAAINAIAPPTLATPTVTATSSITTPTAGVPFTLMASLAGSGSLPTGSVDFYDVSYNLDEGSFALSGGVASATFATSVTGAHVYLLTYKGDSTYASGTAYVVLDVLAATHAISRGAGSPMPPVSGGTGSGGGGGGGQSAASIRFPLPVTSPAITVPPVATAITFTPLIDPELIDDLAVDIATLTTPETIGRVKKYLD